ncbi:amino acid/amide ABC transporter substrate-binding protein, HAAT family [Carboxydocella thermautotrophica]|nr:amino acid/amide ABC transporter substrate-binding protein, HAAT family [Carboxydocella thermautotrophica]
MLKKKASAVLAGLLALSLVATGCGSNSGGGEKKEGGSGSADNVIKIGGNFETTGGVATFGQAAVNGIKLAFKKKNEAGGVLGGKKLELVVADNKSEPAESANATTKLINQDKVVAILGATTSSNTLAAVPVVTASQVPLLSTSATNPKVTVNENGQVNEWVFRACFIDPFQGTVMANFATKDLGAKTAAIMIDTSSDYSKGLASFFKEAFTKNGGTIVAEEGYVQKDTDFKAVLTKIKGKNPDVIYVPGYYEEVGKIIKQGRELGITVPFMGGDGWDSPKLVDIAGAEALNGTYFSNHYAATDPDPEVQKFVEEYKKEYGQVPDSMAVLGYDAALMLIDAIERAGAADPAKIKEALAATKDLKVVTGTITLNEQHNPIKTAAILEMKDGKQVFRTKVNP